METIILKREYLNIVKKEKEILDNILTELNYEEFEFESEMINEFQDLDTIKKVRTKLISKNYILNYTYDCSEYLNYLKLLSEERYEEMIKYKIR